MGQIGRSMIVLGALIALVGIALLLGDRFGLGRLPGDIVLRRKHGTIYFPIVTSVVVSVVLTVILNLFLRRK